MTDPENLKRGDRRQILDHPV